MRVLVCEISFEISALSSAIAYEIDTIVSIMGDPRRQTKWATARQRKGSICCGKDFSKLPRFLSSPSLTPNK